MSHSIEPIPVVAQYFDDPQAKPVIEQEYVPGRGWRDTGYNKRVSKAWLRKLRQEGVTSVALEYGGRVADFRVDELLASH